MMSARANLPYMTTQMNAIIRDVSEFPLLN